MVVCVFGVCYALGAVVELIALSALVPDFVDGLWNVSMSFRLFTPFCSADGDANGQND